MDWLMQKYAAANAWLAAHPKSAPFVCLAVGFALGKVI